MSEWITVRIKRPADYMDVHEDLVAEDAMRSASASGWVWEIVPGADPFGTAEATTAAESE